MKLSVSSRNTFFSVILTFEYVSWSKNCLKFIKRRIIFIIYFFLRLMCETVYVVCFFFSYFCISFTPRSLNVWEVSEIIRRMNITLYCFFFLMWDHFVGTLCVCSSNTLSCFRSMVWQLWGNISVMCSRTRIGILPLNLPSFSTLFFYFDLLDDTAQPTISYHLWKKFVETLYRSWGLKPPLPLKKRGGGVNFSMIFFSNTLF